MEKARLTSRRSGREIPTRHWVLAQSDTPSYADNNRFRLFKIRKGFTQVHGPRVVESGLTLITSHAYSAPYEDLKLKSK